MNDNNNIINMVKEKKYSNALEEIQYKIIENLEEKIEKKKCLNNYSFIQVIDLFIKEIPDYYDMLTYIRNLCFFQERTDIEKLNELTNIYMNLKNK